MSTCCFRGALHRTCPLEQFETQELPLRRRARTNAAADFPIAAYLTSEAAVDDISIDLD